MMKKILSRFILAVILINITLSAGSVFAAGQVWDFDAGTEGWVANKGTLSTANGVMTHTISAGHNNAFLLSPNDLGIDGSIYKYIKIRLRNNNCASRACVVSFITVTDTTWDSKYSTGTKSVVTASGITGYDTDYKDYVIDMSGNEKWSSGTITRLRLLTFLNDVSVTAGSMDIDSIELLEEYEPDEPQHSPSPSDKPAVTDPPATDAPILSEVSITAQGLEGAAVGSYAILSAAAPDNCEKIEIYSGGELAASDQGNSCTCMYQFEAEGVYSFTAKAYYSDGMTGVSEPVETGYIADPLKEREYAARYTFDSGDEGFLPRSGYAELSCEEGRAEVDISASNAYIYKSGTVLDLSAGDYVIIRMMNRTSGSRVILQWKTTEDNTFSDSKKVTFNDTDSLGNVIIKNDNEYREYVFYMGDVDGWKDKHLNFLQVFPSASAESGSVYIDEISLSDRYKEPEPLPVVTVYSDLDDLKCFIGDEIALSAEINGSPVSGIMYYNEGNKLGEAFEEPYGIGFTAAAVGSMEIFAYAVCESGAIVRSENAVSAEVVERYTISTPQIEDTDSGKKVMIDIWIYDDTIKQLTAVAAIYNENGKMLALKSEKTGESGTLTLEFSDNQSVQAKTVLVTVIGDWSEPLGYMKPFVIGGI